MCIEKSCRCSMAIHEGKVVGLITDAAGAGWAEREVEGGI